MEKRCQEPFLVRWAGLIAFCLALGAFLIYYSAKFGLDTPPSSTGDEASYDSLGWQLSHGHGFTLDFDDPQFRAAYDRAAAENPRLFTLGSFREGPITLRPPLFPLVISVTDWLFGRQFWAVRVFNAAAMAATCGLIVHCAARFAGIVPAGISVLLFVVVDVRPRLFGRAILTEALATLLVALLAITLINAQRTKQRRWVALAGLLAGLSILARTAFALWLPGLLVIVFLVFRRPTESASTGNAARACGLFVGVALLTASPWMIRNCLVLESFRPLGTQGMTELSAGYSDAAYEHDGVWTNLATTGFFDDVLTPQMTAVEAELATADFSSRRALEWIDTHPGKTLLLIPLKLYSEFRPYRVGTAIVSVLALIGLATLARRPEGKILIGLILSCAAAVAATWSVEGRFLVSLLFVFHVSAAVGLCRLVGALTGVRSIAGSRPAARTTDRFG